MNSPRGFNLGLFMCSDLGFSHRLKIKAGAKARSKGRLHDPRLKPGAIQNSIAPRLDFSPILALKFRMPHVEICPFNASLWSPNPPIHL